MTSIFFDLTNTNVKNLKDFVKSFHWYIPKNFHGNYRIPVWRYLYQLANLEIFGYGLRGVAHPPIISVSADSCEAITPAKRIKNKHPINKNPLIFKQNS